LIGNGADVTRFTAKPLTVIDFVWTAGQSTGSLKRAHHFGLNRAANFGEQLILQDSVTQSISSPELSSAPGGAAALAAGERLPLLGVACCEPVGGTAWFARGSGLGSSRENKPPDDEHPARASSSRILPNHVI